MGHRLGTADPTAINESWPVKEMKTWNWTKVFLGVIKVSHLHKSHRICKFRCQVELQTNEEKARCKSMLANI